MPANKPTPRLDFGSAGNWNAIEARARQLAHDYKDITYEKGYAIPFWIEFLQIFGVDHKRAGAFFEYRTRKLSGAPGFVDLFWPGRLIAEQKSAGRDLNVAMQQALDYLPAMPDHELPRAVVVSDFQTFDIARLDNPELSVSFTLEQLPDRVRHFGFLFDLADPEGEQSPVNVKAAQDISRLHQDLKAKGYTGEDLQMFLARIVFCLFAEDTGIFGPYQFSQYVRHQSRDDGSNLGRVLNELFEVLNTPDADRMQGLSHELDAFPYVNGGLFDGWIRTPALDTESRSAILTASLQSWSEVNPSIFGSMFQGVMDEVERRNLGAHYTSEKNILRLIQPLFLDDLYAELEAAKGNNARLDRLHTKIANLTFLDPACGSGNFLVITYRELRKLEHKLLRERHPEGLSSLHPVFEIRTSPNQMAGIELEEFPAKVAQLALWLTEHQMNIKAAELFRGSVEDYKAIPITSRPNIVNANALRTDWGEVVELSDLDYIIGNPPFLGKKEQTKEQKRDLMEVFDNHRGSGNLDFVTAWYAKSLEAMDLNPKVQTALVSTNSIIQGEQVPILWKYMFERGAVINFLHQTFKWSNEAPGVAAVYCTIIGFAKFARKERFIFEYEHVREDPAPRKASNINGYGVDAPSIFIQRRSQAICDVPEMDFGSKAADFGALTLSVEDRETLLTESPDADEYVRVFMGSKEFLNNGLRYCLWLKHAPPNIIRNSQFIMDRLEQCREARANSVDANTRAWANRPALFQADRQPESNYLLFPKVSSERREYVPLGFFGPEVIVNPSVLVVPDATHYEFAVLQSNVHMAWMRLVAGRLKGDYQYSNTIVYNNFPWPEKVSEAQRARIEELAQAVLDARAAHPTSTLADLYDPLAMPPNLRQAHNNLDTAVDRLYRSKSFEDDADRVALLLKRYQALTAT